MATVSSVAKDRHALEPEGRCTDAEARDLLQRLCPLLEALGEKTKPPHPNLMKEFAVDSIGRILNEADPEPYRLGLLQAAPHHAAARDCPLPATIMAHHRVPTEDFYRAAVSATACANISQAPPATELNLTPCAVGE